MAHDAAYQMALEFRKLHDQLADTADADLVQGRLVELACAVIDDCEWAALTAWDKKTGPRTVASTGVVAELVSRLQYDAGEGPCPTARLAPDDQVWLRNVFTETRWPTFVQAARAHTPVRSALSCRLTNSARTTVLSLYARAPRQLHSDAVNTAPLFAIQAGALMAHVDSVRASQQLERAVTSNRRIGEAVGVLMTTHNVADETAFKMLRVASNHQNVKLRDVAERVRNTGRLPR